MIRGLWQVKGSDRLGAVRDLLRTMLERQVVQALLVPVEGAKGSTMPALVKNPTRLDRANPFAPVMAFNSARLVSMLTHGGAGARVGAVLRSCEIRALIELAKFNQVQREDLVIVGVDCFGTFAVPEYARARREIPDLDGQLFARAREGNAPELPFRAACGMCEQPTPGQADVAIGFIGVDSAQALVVEVRDDLAEVLGIRADSTGVQEREAAVGKLTAARTARRDAELSRFRQEIRGPGGMASYFADCMECTNCMNACPICYCKECFFRTANAEHAPRELLRSAEREGALSMPPEAVLFHLTRLNHMATSCVGCGMCEAACPHDVPLTVMFRSVAGRVQKIFDYVPGRSLDDKPPFMEFRQEELLDLGEAK